MSGPKEIVSALDLYLKKFPFRKDLEEYKKILKKIVELRIYELKPTYMRFLNDELYGKEGVKEFRFDNDPQIV